MCGIVGIISENESIRENFCKKSPLNTIIHRGPDFKILLKAKFLSDTQDYQSLV